MRERETLAELILGVSSSDREKWLTEQLSKDEPYPWQPRRILPERRNSKGFLCVEIIGLPESGKTSGFQFLLEKLPEDFPQVVGVSEFGEEEVGVNTIKDLSDEFAKNVYLNSLKLNSFQKGVIEVTDLLLEDVVRQKEPGPKILICDRGAIDEVALAFRAKSNENFEEKDPELMKEVLRIFLIGMAHTEILIDAVVLYGVSLDTAIRRRKERGLSSEGRVTNELIWPTFEYSYSWWLGSVYPLLRKRSGTGLLIIDGEGEKEENNLNLLSYVKEATELIF